MCSHALWIWEVVLAHTVRHFGLTSPVRPLTSVECFNGVDCLKFNESAPGRLCLEENCGARRNWI